jgi:7-keto-8-aminopelargonate synthetase-like enzyme
VLQACCFPVQNGVMLSRARALYFKHNDMADLERVLQKVAAEDRRQQCVSPLSQIQLRDFRYFDPP